MPCNFSISKSIVNSIAVNFSPSFETFANLLTDNYHSQAMAGFDTFGHPPIKTNKELLKAAIVNAFKVAETSLTGTGWSGTAGSILANGLVMYWMGSMMSMGLGPGMAPNIPISNIVVSGGFAQPIIYNSFAGQVVGNLTNTIQSMFWDIANIHKNTISGLYSYLMFVPIPGPPGFIYVPMSVPWVSIN